MTDDPISLGMGAGLGCSGSDLTSPTQAANVGAIPDTLAVQTQQDGARWSATELRVHGVSGSNGPTMLEHPAVVQVAGDSITMFYRRWNPSGTEGTSVPWKLEAYSWGGLTEAPLAAASSNLLAPFMMFNLGQFMLPPSKNRQREKDIQRVSRDRWHAVAVALLRLLALTATVQFVLAAVAVLVNVLAYQGRQAHTPAWLGAYTQRSADLRVALATVAIIGVVALMWWISVTTANRYEARLSAAPPRLRCRASPLTQPSFWAVVRLVGRQRCLHAAAALAVTAIVVARPAKNSCAGFRELVLVIAGVTLLAAAERYRPTWPTGMRWFSAERRCPSPKHPAPDGPGRTDAGTWWCRGVLAIAGGALAASGFTGGWHDTEPAQPRTVPGLNAVCGMLLVGQAALLMFRARSRGRGVRAQRTGEPERPCLGAVPWWPPDVGDRGAWLEPRWSVLDADGGVRQPAMGAPVPSGLEPRRVPPHAPEIPWPMYAFAAAPIGLLAFAIVAAGWLSVVWRARVRSFERIDVATGKSKVGE